MIGRGRNAVETPVDRPTQALRQIDAPVLAEGRDRLAGLRVQADQVAVARAEQDASIVPVRPVGDAAMHEAVVGRRSVLPRLRVVDPPGLACGRVDGRDLGERGADIQDAVDHQRRGLPHPGSQLGIRFRDLLFGGAPRPRDLKAAEIVSADLVDRRILRTGLVAAIAQPFRRCTRAPLRLSICGLAGNHCHADLKRRDHGRSGNQGFTPRSTRPDLARCWCRLADSDMGTSWIMGSALTSQLRGSSKI